MAEFVERGQDAVAMVALHLDDAVLDGAARAAGGAQLLAQRGQGVVVLS